MKKELVKNAIVSILILCSLIALLSVHEDASLSTNLICGASAVVLLSTAVLYANKK